jgi:hypothetical protein
VKESRCIGRVLKAITAYFKVLPRHALGVSDVNHEVLVRIAVTGTGTPEQ